VNRGGSVTYTVTVVPQNGFTGSVGLSASGSKTGLSLSLSSSSVTIANTSGQNATLTAKTSPSARKGNNTLTVSGTSGALAASGSASLRIN
jgi:hypothetical protein